MIVLDTHALVWMDRNDSMLGPQTRALIENTWRSDVVAGIADHGVLQPRRSFFVGHHFRMARKLATSQFYPLGPILGRGLSPIDYNSGMSNISLQELAHDPAALLDRVEAGERIVVVRGGRPVAELRPIASVPLVPRPFGLAAGTFTVPADFDSPLPDDILREFEGR